MYNIDIYLTNRNLQRSYNMLGHLGFSYVGMIYLLMLFIPNIIWSKNQPIDYDITHENKILLLFERIGHIGVHIQHLKALKKI